MFMYL